MLELHVGAWPTGLTSVVLQAAKEIGSSEEGTQLTVAVPNPPAEPNYREALREALRSVVHASVLERPSIRVNLVYGGTPDDYVHTLTYLDEATFVVGAAIDLDGQR